jgi:glycosyltransferase involved in cell wall biosynthesis
VFQNQVMFYRDRGYTTVFLAVPIHSSFTPTHPDWEVLKEGILELGADRAEIAPVNHQRFIRSKYTAWVGHGFRGTALDWIVNTGKSADLSPEASRYVAGLTVTAMHVNHVFTMGFAQKLRRYLQAGEKVPIILETHDVQSHLMRERKDVNPWTHKYDSPDRLVRSEIALLKKPDVLVHCSADDYKFFAERLPKSKHVLALPTIDESFVRSVQLAESDGTAAVDLLFVGQSTDVNLAAVRWFFEKIWPLISDRSYSLRIVGAVGSLVRQRLPELYRQFECHFVGAVPDLSPYYRSSRCVIAPMVFGTGISIKTVEALCLGKPFVGTSVAFRGIPADRMGQAGLRAHDAPEEFAGAIVAALSGQNSDASHSRLAYETLFSQRAAFLARDAALRLAIAP